MVIQKEQKEEFELEDIDIEVIDEDDFDDIDNIDEQTETLDEQTDIITDIDVCIDDDDEDDDDEEIIEEEEYKQRRRNVKITIPKLSVFEKTKILSYRAQQLAKNAKPLIDMSKLLIAPSPYNIAVEELRQKRIPFKVKRELPDNSYEIWDITEFVFI